LAGDATEDAVLVRAGVSRAAGRIVTTGNDSTKMYIVLSARVLNPGLYIVSRAGDESGVTKLIRAGANRAISPYAIGGHRLAHLILNPAVVDFFDTALRRGSDALALEVIAVPQEKRAPGDNLGALDIQPGTRATVPRHLRGRRPLGLA